MELSLFRNQYTGGNNKVAISQKSEQNALQLIEQRVTSLSNDVVRSKLSPNEFKVAVAGTKMPIRLYGENEFKDEIFASAQFIRRDIGIAKWDADDENTAYDNVRFIQILKSYYSDLTIEEVINAFEMAAIGDLDDFLPKDKDGNPDKNHYQSFTMDYYTKILNAYKKKRSGVWSKVKLALPAPELKATPEQIKLINKHFQAEIYEAYYNYQKGVKPNFSLSAYIKELQGLGHIKDLPVPVLEDYKKAYQKILLSDHYTRDQKKKIKEGWAQKNVIPASIKTEAELMIYNDAIARIFDVWIDNKFDLIPKDKKDGTKT